MRLPALLRPPPSLHDVENALLLELGHYDDGGRHVPNAWQVTLSPRDLARRRADLPHWSAVLGERLLQEHQRRGLPASGLITVAFAGAADIGAGTFRITSAVVAADAAVVRRPELLPGRPRLTIAAGGTAAHGSPAGAGIERDVLLKAGRFVIGRDKDADLRLRDATVSPRHILLEVSPHGDKVRLTDLGSLNGTKVDGVPSVAVDLVDGNRVELGETTLLFHRDQVEEDGGREGGEGE